MKRISTEKALKYYKIIAWTYAIALLISVVVFCYQAKEVRDERLLREASMELMMFAINISSYCAESNNMTYQELTDGYIIHMAKELTSDRFVLKGDEE